MRNLVLDTEYLWYSANQRWHLMDPKTYKGMCGDTSRFDDWHIFSTPTGEEVKCEMCERHIVLAMMAV